MISPFYKQMLAVSGMLTLFFGTGLIMGLISIMLPSLRKPDSGIKMTMEQESWIASIYFLMSFPTKCTAGYLLEKYGRKYIIICSLIPLLITNITMYLALDFTLLFTSMTIFGLSAGGITGTIMAAEISSPKYRGFLLNSRILLFVLGSMIPHFLGKFFGWRDLVLWNCVPVVYGLVVSSVYPESPAWLASQGRFKECKAAYIWFRGNNEEAELQQLIHSQRKALLEQQTKNLKERSKIRKLVKYICDKSFLKAVVVCFVCISVLEASGKVIFTVYAIDVFVIMAGDKQYANYFALAMDIEILICSTISCFILLKFKNRIILFSTGILAVLFLLLFCLFSFLISVGLLSVNNGYYWIKPAFLFMYFSISDLGLTPVVQVLWTEVYPLSHRGLGVTISAIVYAVFTFSLIKTLPSMLKLFGVQVFLINAAVIGLGLIYLYIFVPETSEKTLIDIENEMKVHNKNEYSVCKLKVENNSTTDKKELV